MKKIQNLLALWYWRRNPRGYNI